MADARVALVTGAGHRVGRAIALGLAEAGHDLAVHYHASRDGAEETARMVRAAGRRAWALGIDLTDAAAPERLAQEVIAQAGRLDVLVNSAAIMERTPFGQVEAATWDHILNLNLRAPFLLAQAVAPILPDGGCIVNIADLAAFETWPGYIPHGVSKSGIVYLTRALARVLAPRLRVNAVAPGTVLLPEDMDPAAAEHLTRTTPLRRDGSPADVVQAVRYLLDATYVTGEVILVDGGRHVRR